MNPDQDYASFDNLFLRACGREVFTKFIGLERKNFRLKVQQEQIKSLLRRVLLKAYELKDTSLSSLGDNPEARAKRLVDLVIVDPSAAGVVVDGADLAMVPITPTPDLSEDYGDLNDLEGAVFPDEGIDLDGMSGFPWDNFEESAPHGVDGFEAAGQGVSAPPGGWDMYAGGALPSSVTPGIAPTSGFSGSVASGWPPVVGSALGKRSERDW